MQESSAAPPSVPVLPVSEPPASDRNHLHALTGLRIFAAVAVYFSHLDPPAGAAPSVATGLASGYYGVTFFFTLSGFVLAINYFDALKRATARGLWSYGVARIARVYPLYLLVLLYVIARTSQSGDPLGSGWIVHVLALQAWSPDLYVAYSYNLPAWSIGVEIFLYAALPLLIPAIARLDRGLGWLMVTAAVVATVMVVVAIVFTTAGLNDLSWAAPSSAHRWLYRNPLFRLGDFALGILAARLFLRLRLREHRELLGGALIFLALSATLLFATRPAFFHSAASWDVGYAVPAFALLLGLALAPGNVVARILALPVIVLFGEASYAFYLVHAPALITMGADAWANEVSALTVAIQVFQLAIIMALAVGLHIVVEKPARTWLRRVLMVRRKAPA
jgi:peptidoglycan/LPS O-acetylase OafA/YrhL